MKTTFIYALLDDAGKYCYVGQSGNPARRFRDHKSAGHVLAEVPRSTCKAAETRFIALFRAQGCALRNKNNGGGGPTWHTEEAREKISAAASGEKNHFFGKGPMLGKKHSPETRAKISTALKGKTHSSERRAKISAVQKGKTLSTEHRAKLSVAHRGKPCSADKRAKLSAALKGRVFSAETRAKMSAAHRGKKRV